MKLIAMAALAALSVAGLPASASADTTPVPTITKITLATRSATTSPGSPCVSIPIAVTYATNGDFVYEIDVYVTHGTLPSDTTGTATQLLAPGTTTGGTLTGTLDYCPSTQGIGALDAGPSKITYATPTQVGSSVVDDPATAPFDVRQESVAKLTAHRHHQRVTLHAFETYFDYRQSAERRTTGQKAYLQVLNTKSQKYGTIGKAKPSAKTGYATFTVKSKRTLNYRVVFAQSNTIAASVSQIVSK